jgi:hypothetical protein
VAERATFHSHWLEEGEALGAAFERAQSWEAEVAAQLASLALEHTLGAAVHARCAELAAWSGVALEAALRVAALLAARAGFAATRFALGGAVDLAAIVAALERARIWLATQPEARALEATIGLARAISELAVEARASCGATGWRTSVTASGKNCAACHRSGMAHAAWPLVGGVDAARHHVPWLVEEARLASTWIPGCFHRNCCGCGFFYI